jgi:redox-sensitive bicupin YhaK (pirin superfamily)
LLKNDICMNRKDFLKKGILGTGVFATTGSIASIVTDNDIDELKKIEVLGFNHIPTKNSKIMASTVLHKANSRGLADHGWLNSRHSFSFAHYYDPERMHFGALRVLNDDRVAPGMGFGKHPHDNMEIISIPLEGDLEHQDSMGNTAVIKKGDVQVMSAGKGIYHSEYNRNKDQEVKFLQIWVFPNKRDVTPRYDQLTLTADESRNQLQQILSPSPDDAGVWIHQDAWFHLGRFDKGIKTDYTLRKKGNGVYAFVLKGDVQIAGNSLNTRDGLGIWDTGSVSIEAESDAEFLLMEVPMTV